MMVFGKVKSALFKVFKRGHPDIYDALKDYCDKHGYNMSDVVASAVAAFMSADTEGKDELIEKMSQRRAVQPSGSPLQVKTTLELFKDFCGVMKEMFSAMNEARANMSIQAMLSDFKAVSNAMTEIQKAGSEGGKGSMEDLLASAIITRILGGFGVKKPPSNTTPSGRGKVMEVGEE